MPRKKFDKASSTTFQVVHRPQDDPRIHDDSASSAVFKEIAPPQGHKIKSRRELESELFSDTASSSGEAHIRDNEGEAAEHGIYYDDTEYDYMQHIRDLKSGTGDGDAFFVEAKRHNATKKGKDKVTLEEALQNSSLRDSSNESTSSDDRSSLANDAAASDSARHLTYQNQQDIPDALAGFQPDMDPRLREVLVALEDDAYVDDEEDFFAQIADGGQEITQEEFELNDEFGDDDGWESDATERPLQDTHRSPAPFSEHAGDGVLVDGEVPPLVDTEDGDWMKEFRKFKKDPIPLRDGSKPHAMVDNSSSVMTGETSLVGKRRKKRKGALTSSAGYSMTSSSLARTEGQSLLDARFDKIAEMYGADEEDEMDLDDSMSSFTKNTGVSMASGLSRASAKSNWSTASSQAPDLASGEFGSMMDDFLGSNAGAARGVKRKGKQGGLAELDEIRKELGPARIKAQKAR